MRTFENYDQFPSKPTQNVEESDMVDVVVAAAAGVAIESAITQISAPEPEIADDCGDADGDGDY